MGSYAIGKQITVTVTVTDKATAALVDPGTFLFSLQPSTDQFAYALSTYAWNGATWTNSESTIAVPSRVSLGVFRLTVSIPHANIARGSWAVDWYHTANGGGLGQGGDNTTFVVTPSKALP